MIQRSVDPDLDKDIETLAGEVFEDPQAWLDAPHQLLGGDSPRELMRQQPDSERIVRALLEGIKHGFSP